MIRACSIGMLSILPLALMTFLPACSTPNQGTTTVTGPPPPVAGQRWEVGDAITYSCGALTCHGSKYRNMRVYGYGSLREDPNTLPGSIATTDSEYDLTYRGIIGLEPEVMTAVVNEKTNFDRLALVRKAHGLDNHKGYTPMPPGSAMETCLLSWLKSDTDVDACKTVSAPITTTDAGP